MAETNYKYEREMEYVPFKKRFMKASRTMFIIQTLLLALVASISIRFSIYTLFLLFLGIVGLSALFYVYLMRKKNKYFLKSVKITNDHVINLEMYRKNEKIDHQMNLENLDITLEVTGGGRSGRLTFTIVFSYKDQLIGQQSDFGKWKTHYVKDLFSTIKNYKGESLTVKEADLLKLKRGFFG